LIYRVRGKGALLERNSSVPMPEANAVGVVEQNFTAQVTNVLRLRGRVLDTSGVPLPNAFLRITSPYRQFRANANGEYDAYEVIPEGVTNGLLRLEATNANASAFVGRDLTYQVTQTGVTELAQDLQLQANIIPPVIPIETIKTRRFTLVGRVLSALQSGQGLARTQVRIRAPGSIVGDVCSTETNTDGRYSCGFELSTNQAFSAEVTVSGLGTADPINVDITADELPAPGGSSSKTVPDITAKATILQVSGVVRAQGNVVVGANVSASFAGYGASGQTDASGRYTVRFAISDVIPPAAKLQLEATFTTPAGLSKATSSVDVGTITSGTLNARVQDLEFVTRQLAFTGMLKNVLANGQPVGGADIEILRNGQIICRAFSSTSTISGGLGQYSCNYSVTSPDAFQVTYQVKNRGNLVLQNVTVDPSNAPINGLTPITRDLEVSPTTLRLTGRITKTGGAVVPNANIELSGGITASFQANASGVYSAAFDFPDTQTNVQFALRASENANLITRTLDVSLATNTLTTRTEDLEIVTSNSGTLKWTYTNPIQNDSLEIYDASAVGPDGTQYIMNYQSSLFKYELVALAPDGTKRWAYSDFAESLSDARLEVGSDGVIYVSAVYDALNLYAINPNGTRKYLFQTGDELHSRPIPAADGSVFAVFGTKLHKISSTGSNLWSVSINPSARLETAGIKILASGALAVASSCGYNCGPDKGALALVNASGLVTRVTQFDVGYDRVERVDNDGTMYLYREDVYEGPSAEFTVLNSDGSVRWTREYVNGYLVASDGTIYFDDSSKIVAVDANQNALWSADISGQLLGLTTNGMTIVSSRSSGQTGDTIIGLNSDGTTKWSYQTGASVNYYNETVISDTESTVYMKLEYRNSDFTLNYRILALKSDGKPKWQFGPTDQLGLSSPKLFGNIIYFNSNSKAYAINR
jgi:protocatechuate 3,4-dioxygenase beta subunit